MLIVVKKRNSLFSIFKGDLPIGVLNKRELKNLLLTIGDNTIETNKYNLLLSGIKNYAKKRLFDYISKMERSKYQAHLYLERLQLEKSLIQPIINEFEKSDYINDKRMAEQYVYLYILKGKSKNYIINKLISIGISKEDFLENLLEQYNSSQKKIISKELEKAKKKFSNLTNDQKKYFKILEYMKRRGFTFDEVNSEIRYISEK